MDAGSAMVAALELIVGRDPQLLQIISLSLRVTLAAVLVAALVGLPFGAMLALWRFPGRSAVIVSVNVVEGTRKRVQAYEGVVIAKRNRGLNSGFTVRKISSGEGVERTFQTYSPLIAGIEVKRRGDVRRAKLYYLRQRSGKSARIKEKLS